MSTALYAASSRFSTRAPDRTTHHSFSFGPHYDPANLGFGPMVCHNDDLLEPGGGYPDHPHTDLEIVTWVLDGVLLHTDDRGTTTEVRPGQVQVMSAGSGLRHAEMADAGSGPTRFLQTWIRPDEAGTPPRWRVEAVDPGPGLTTVVGPDGLGIGTRGASLHIARLAPGTSVRLPDGALQHVFVAVGAGRLVGVGASAVGEGAPAPVTKPPVPGFVTGLRPSSTSDSSVVEEGAPAPVTKPPTSGFVTGLRPSSTSAELAAGDAARLTGHPGAVFEASADTELLVWSFAAG